MNELFESSYLSIMSAENDRLRKQLQQKENIIKEAREYIKEAIISESTEFYGLIDGEHVLALLDKGE